MTSHLTPTSPLEVMASPPLTDELTDGQRGEGPACVWGAGLPDPGNHPLGTPTGCTNRPLELCQVTPPHPQAPDPPSGRGSIQPQHSPHLLPRSTFQILSFSPQWASPPLLRTYVTSILLGLLASGVSPDPAPLHGSNPGASPVQDLAGSLLSVKTEPSDLSGVGGSPH